ncbi:MAG: hydroxymethylpyrimidine/phosphomethylpyrimidine kinase [Bacteroidetes bacterium]|jgi:hydroxymethylpyrimidine/phosphomethylpyrimidine kinase|nr:hydroxymethylpyrimidine/phosphomethylpyrimidine kinase [Bacteroidota bacterium]MBP7255992.1 hydroxymethylpyrimidine/phosphomethylpyrimidine kinase [Chitinophagales bacterium]MBK7138571.1 hydroxymethylpyrimidine/phosphomethylpyrimidine kinase [Bacteroidota bacterium]MBK7503944.1 hydroxymethylpyrimidine/phosphomethylpyrimidine kinase [Bacteroidota bacterium]MBK7638971.1 hydroxymethylpyrimidine/phosphomethylpyrimidine kinase [Bacteroidota bacterium]
MSINPRPIVLSIAGFDPSGGAGLLADIKTIESHKVYGLGVLTCSTLQNELVFKEINWLETAYIKNQIKLLHQVSKIEVVKIGLVKSLKSLKKITQYLLELNPFVKIIWDPILSSSSGFVFHKKWNSNELYSVLEDLYLITPNWEEIKMLFQESEPLEAAEALSKYCPIFLKGGHNQLEKGVDYLFFNGKTTKYSLEKISNFQKHGSGCVLSSSIASNIALGKTLEEACRKAKIYTLAFLESSENLLGYHNMTK